MIHVALQMYELELLVPMWIDIIMKEKIMQRDTSPKLLKKTKNKYVCVIGKSICKS